jgi:hypothetical protein
MIFVFRTDLRLEAALWIYTCSASAQFVVSISIAPLAVLGCPQLVHLGHPQLELLVLALLVGVSLGLLQSAHAALCGLARRTSHFHGR